MGKTNNGPDREPDESLLEQAREITRDMDVLTASLPFDDDPLTFQSVLEELAPEDEGDDDHA